MRELEILISIIFACLFSLDIAFFSMAIWQAIWPCNLCLQHRDLFILIGIFVLVIILSAVPRQINDDSSFQQNENFQNSYRKRPFQTPLSSMRAQNEVNRQRVEDFIEKENEKWRSNEEETDGKAPPQPPIASPPPGNKARHATKNEYDSTVKNSDSESFSTSFSERSFSMSSTTSTSSSRSTTASSLRARAELNGRAEDYIKQTHENWRFERQMDTSPWPSPASSPPTIHKVGKNQESKYVDGSSDNQSTALSPQNSSDVNVNQRSRRSKTPSNFERSMQKTEVSVSIADCAKLLEEMEGMSTTPISDKAIHKAIEFFRDPVWREAFAAWTVKRRYRWLKYIEST